MRPGSGLEAGAEGITVHPRPDQRHIRPHDVDDVARLLKDYPRAEYNIEGNPFLTSTCGMRSGFGRRSARWCRTPSRRRRAITGGIWREDAERLRPVIAELKSFGCRVSACLMDADPRACIPGLVRELGADRIELQHRSYA